MSCLSVTYITDEFVNTYGSVHQKLSLNETENIYIFLNPYAQVPRPHPISISSESLRGTQTSIYLSIYLYIHTHTVDFIKIIYSAILVSWMTIFPLLPLLPPTLHAASTSMISIALFLSRNFCMILISIIIFSVIGKDTSSKVTSFP